MNMQQLCKELGASPQVEHVKTALPFDLDSDVFSTCDLSLHETPSSWCSNNRKPSEGYASGDYETSPMQAMKKSTPPKFRQANLHDVARGSFNADLIRQLFPSVSLNDGAASSTSTKPSSPPPAQHSSLAAASQSLLESDAFKPDFLFSTSLNLNRTFSFGHTSASGSSAGHELSPDDLSLLACQTASAGFPESNPFLTTPARYRSRPPPPRDAAKRNNFALDVIPHLEFRLPTAQFTASMAQSGGSRHSAQRQSIEYCHHCEHCKLHREQTCVESPPEPLLQNARGQLLKLRHRSGRVEVGSLAVEGITFLALHLLASFGGRGNMLHNLNQPVGLCFDNSGGLILVDEQNHRLLSYPLSAFVAPSGTRSDGSGAEKPLAVPRVLLYSSRLLPLKICAMRVRSMLTNAAPVVQLLAILQPRPHQCVHLFWSSLNKSPEQMVRLATFGNEFLDYPRAICCDNEGTLFIMESRFPYVYKVHVNLDNLLVALRQQQKLQLPQPAKATSASQKGGDSFECASLPRWQTSQCYCSKVEYCGISVERLMLSDLPIPKPSSTSTTPRSSRTAPLFSSNVRRASEPTGYGTSASSSFFLTSRIEPFMSNAAEPLATAPELLFPMDICCSPLAKEFYLCDNRANRIHVYNYNGKYCRSVELPNSIRYPTAMWTDAGRTPLAGSTRLFVASNSVTLCVAEYALERHLLDELGELTTTSERLLNAYACPETRERLLSRGISVPSSTPSPIPLSMLAPNTNTASSSRAREATSSRESSAVASSSSGTPRSARGEHFNADQTFERIHNMVTLPDARLVLITCADHCLHVFHY